MNDTLTLCLEILFWFALFVVFYTYLGYGILLYILVKLKEFFVKPVRHPLPATDGELPEVTLIAPCDPLPGTRLLSPPSQSGRSSSSSSSTSSTS